MDMNKTTSDKKVVIIGAGPAGLTAAYELSKVDLCPTVLEKTYRMGGLSCTESFNGYRFDMGGHRFFTKVAKVNRIWDEILGDDFLQRPRLSRIYYRQRFFHYPLKPINALMGLGIWQSLLIGLSYLKWQVFPYPVEETFEEWVTNRFGKRLFLTFFKSYTEKVWGIPCSELKAEWAAQRIKNLSLKTALVSMFLKPKETIKTLIEQFHYPRFGPGMMWGAVRDRIQRQGGAVRMNTEVIEIRRRENCIDGVVVSCNGHKEVVKGTDFISSMPITEFIKKLYPRPPSEVLEAANKLKYRDFLTVCLIVNRPKLFPDNWIYIHEPSVKVGRIQNFKNWSPEMVSDPMKTSLGLEYFCSEGDELWCMPDDDLIELGKRELDRIGLASYDDIEDGCVFRIPKAYPIYDSDYQDYLTVLKEFVDKLENFQTIGRNGLHRYNNQDHAMLTGILAVRNLVQEEQNDLWSVNTDQEYHEEIRTEKDITADKVAAAVQEALTRVFSKLDPIAFGLSLGMTAGFLVFVMTVALVLKGGDVIGPNLQLLSQYFPGYKVTGQGSVLGLVYGFVAAFFVGWSFAFLRNSTLFLYTAIIHRGAELRALRRLLEYIH